MELITPLGNILTSQLWLKRSTDITISITIRQKILEIMESLRKFMDLHQTINLFSHSHGEEQRKLIHQMDSRTHLGNGSIKKLWSKRSTDITIIIKLKILEIMVLLRKFMALPRTINQFSHNHGEEQRKHILKTDSRTHPGNGFHFQKKRRETSVIKELLKKFMDSHQTTSLSYLNHGEESQNHTKIMVSRTQSSNGSINQNLLLRKQILVTRRLTQESSDSHQTITVYSQPHIQE
jgi:hypothetical protein